MSGLKRIRSTAPALALATLVLMVASIAGLSQLDDARAANAVPAWAGDFNTAGDAFEGGGGGGGGGGAAAYRPTLLHAPTWTWSGFEAKCAGTLLYSLVDGSNACEREVRKHVSIILTICRDPEGVRTRACSDPEWWMDGGY